MEIKLNEDQKIVAFTSDDAYKVMREILLREDTFRRKQEFFWTMGLSNSGHIEFVELVALGKLNSVHIAPREIFGYAIQSRCKSLILVHNHPSGNLHPSIQDLMLTEKAIAASIVLEIDIVDHMIITEKDHTSFSEQVKVFYKEKRKKTRVLYMNFNSGSDHKLQTRT